MTELLSQSELEKVSKNFENHFGMSFIVFQEKLENRIKTDTDFKNKYTINPAKTIRYFIEEEVDIELPPDFETELEKRLKKHKTKTNIELSDEELDHVAGGSVLISILGAAAIDTF